MSSAASLACAPIAPTNCASGSAGWPAQLRRTLGLDTMREALLDPVITERIACDGYTHANTYCSRQSLGVIMPLYVADPR